MIRVNIQSNFFANLLQNFDRCNNIKCQVELLCKESNFPFMEFKTRKVSF